MGCGGSKAANQPTTPPLRTPTTNTTSQGGDTASQETQLQKAQKQSSAEISQGNSAGSSDEQKLSNRVENVNTDEPEINANKDDSQKLEQQGKNDGGVQQDADNTEDEAENTVSRENAGADSQDIEKEKELNEPVIDDAKEQVGTTDAVAKEDVSPETEETISQKLQQQEEEDSGEGDQVETEDGMQQQTEEKNNTENDTNNIVSEQAADTVEGEGLPRETEENNAINGKEDSNENELNEQGKADEHRAPETKGEDVTNEIPETYVNSQISEQEITGTSAKDEDGIDEKVSNEDDDDEQPASLESINTKGVLKSDGVHAKSTSDLHAASQSSETNPQKAENKRGSKGEKFRRKLQKTKSSQDFNFHRKSWSDGTFLYGHERRMWYKTPLGGQAAVETHATPVEKAAEPFKKGEGMNAKDPNKA